MKSFDNQKPVNIVSLLCSRHWILPLLTLDDAEAVGVVGAEGAEGREAPLWEAEEEERVGEALREPGLERRPRERNVVRPWGPPSGRMNFSLSSRLVRPRAEKREEKHYSRGVGARARLSFSGGGGGSKQGEAVVWLQTLESVHVWFVRKLFGRTLEYTFIGLVCVLFFLWTASVCKWVNNQVFHTQQKSEKRPFMETHGHSKQLCSGQDGWKFTSFAWKKGSSNAALQGARGQVAKVGAVEMGENICVINNILTC